MCDQSHRAIECPFISRWEAETLLFNLLKRKEDRGQKISITEENELRKSCNIPKDLCEGNPAREHNHATRLPGRGPYCKYCNTREHPTLFCNVHCDMCLKKGVGHGWRTCPVVENRQKVTDKDTNLRAHLDKIHRRWKGREPPRL